MEKEKLMAVGVGIIAFAMIGYWWGAGLSLPVFERGHGEETHPMTLDIYFQPRMRQHMPKLRVVVSGAHHRATHYESQDCDPTWSRHLGSGRDCRWLGAHAIHINVLPDETDLTLTVREYMLLWSDSGSASVPINRQLYEAGHSRTVGVFNETITVRARLPPN